MASQNAQVDTATLGDLPERVSLRILADGGRGIGEYVLSEVLELFSDAGVDVSVAKINYMISTRRIWPRIDGAGNRKFSVEDLVRIFGYVNDPPKRGRKPKSDKNGTPVQFG